MTDFEKLTNFDNLYHSYRVSMRGKGKAASASRFDLFALENILDMKRRLEDRTYTISPYSEFVISEPKKRIIKSGSFRDKVLQHCLCDYVLLPTMKDSFIIDNYAGQQRKGTHFGLDRLSENMTDYYRKHESEGFILKCDISKFFYSIDHDVLKSQIRTYFSDQGIHWLCDLLIDSTDNPGLPLGNQTSQVFGLIYLSGLDHYITEELGCVYYGRYMDDFYLIDPSKDYLKDCLLKIQDYLSDLKLSTNNKTEIVPLRKGIRFLGFHFYLTDDGKIIRKLSGDNKRHMKKRLRTYAKLVFAGKMTRAEFDERYIAWRNHASHGNCIKLIHSMDEFVESLFAK